MPKVDLPLPPSKDHTYQKVGRNVCSSNPPVSHHDNNACDNQNVDTRDSISGDHRGRNLSIGDKVVLFLFSEKGKYNRISDIPDRVALSEFRRAYDMQRIIGCSVTMIILGLVVYFGIRRTKRQISESPIHGELLDSTIDGFGHNVGQPRPARNTARGEYREGT